MVGCRRNVVGVVGCLVGCSSDVVGVVGCLVGCSSYVVGVVGCLVGCRSDVVIVVGCLVGCRSDVVRVAGCRLDGVVGCGSCTYSLPCSINIGHCPLLTHCDGVQLCKVHTLHYHEYA